MNILSYIFLFSLLLIKAPSFYVLPFYSKLVSSHSLAKLLFVLMLLILINRFRKKIKYLYQQVVKNKIFLFIIIFFIGQSISVITAKDISLFWKSYHNIIIGILIFLNTYLIIKLEKISFRALHVFVLSTGVFLILFEALFFLFPAIFLPFFKIIIQKETMDAYLTNIYKGKSSLELNLEIFFPIFLSTLIILKNKKLVKYCLLLVVIFIAYLSAFSNFRTRIVLLLFSYFSSFLIYIYQNYKVLTKEKNILLIFSLLFILIVIGSYFGIKRSEAIYSFNIFNRFTLENRIRDFESVNYRINSITKSVEQFKSSPFFGVGLGNFSYHDSKEIFYYDISRSFLRSYYDLAHLSPHNIFFQTIGETGLIGTISFVCLLVYMLFQDISYIQRKKNILLNGYMLASWGFIVYSLFNPSSSIFVLGWFWFFRGLIVSYKSNI